MMLSKIVLVIACLGLVACGKEEEKPQPVVLVESQQEVNEPLVFTDGFDCSSQVVTDRKSQLKACKKVMNQREAWNCKSITRNLLAKYPGLNCKLPPNQSGRVQFFQERDLVDTLKLLQRWGW